MVAGLLIPFVIAILSITLWYLQNKKIRKQVDTIPGPPALPLFGNAHQLKRTSREFYDQMEQFCHTYSDRGIFRLWLSMQPLVAVYKDEYIEILNDFVGVFNDQAQTMKKRLDGMVGKGSFNVSNYITLCALDVICETAMGRTADAQSNSESEYVKCVNKITELILQRQRTPWFWPDFLYNSIGYGKEHDYCLGVLHRFTEKVIEEKKQELSKMQNVDTTIEDIISEHADSDTVYLSREKRLAFLDMLLCARENGEKMTSMDIREEVDTFMFEGHDTTAAAMNWTIHLIGANPDIQRKVQQELDDIFGNSERPITMKDLKDMKYLECCIKESLRIFPSVPFFGRSITEDCKLGQSSLRGKQMENLVIKFQKLTRHYIDTKSTTFVCQGERMKNVKIGGEGHISPQQSHIVDVHNTRVCLDLDQSHYIPFLQMITVPFGPKRDYDVPKGTTTVVVTAALHRDPKYFPNPDMFDPDRFLPENAIGRHPYAYVPFSAGPRNCIGQKFALLEEKALLSSILRRFTVVSKQTREELNPIGDLIMRPEFGIFIELEHREK